MKTMIKVVAAAAIVALGITGCDPIEPVDPGPTPEGKTFRVDMTDGPANYARMDIQITGVEIYHDTRGWITLNTTARTINILSLANGVNTNLGIQNDAAVGHYSRVRIRFADHNTVQLNSAVDIGGVHLDAGATARLKWGRPEYFVDIAIDEYVTADAGADVMLDFDAERSVQQTLAAFVLDPVITAVTNYETGARGVVAGGNTAAFVKFSAGSRSYSAYATYEGRFVVRGMAEGNYTMTVTTMRRESATGAMVEKTYVRENVYVRGGGIIDVGTIQF
jgi:hypothetical protein